MGGRGAYDPPDFGRIEGAAGQRRRTLPIKVEIVLEQREVAFLSPSNMPSTFEFFGCAVEIVFCCIAAVIQPNISGCQQDFIVVWR